MKKKRALISSGLGIIVVALAVVLILTQCHGSNPSGSSSSSSSSASSSLSSSSQSSSSLESSTSQSSSSSSQAAVHTVLFENYDGTPIQSTDLQLGQTIIPPAATPTRPGQADLSYAFTGWSNYEEAMMVTGDMTFTAEYSPYTSGIVFGSDAVASSVKNLSGFSSNRLLIPALINGKAITEFEADACSNNLMIDTILFSPSITHIGANAFAGCDNIKNVFFQGSSSQWDGIVIDAGNSALADAVLFYSESALAGGWHYVEEIPTPWDVPAIHTLTLDTSNAPAIPTDSFTDASMVVDGFTFDYMAAKALAGQHVALQASMMNQGTLANATASPINSMTAITVTFPAYGGTIRMTAGGTSYSLASGVRVEFGNSPSYFEISIEPDIYSHDLYNASASLTSITIEYTNIPAKTVPIYTLADDQSSYIVSSYSGDLVDAIIPHFYKGLPVTEVGSKAFYNCTTLVNVSLPESITKISEYAFSGCSLLKSFELPSNLVSIGDYAFSSDQSLTYFHLPASLESIGRGCFAYSNSINEMTFAEGIKLTTLSTYAFIYNVFSTIRIPEGVTSTDFDIFQSNASLTTVYIPLSLTTIGDSTFSNCPNISDIYYAGSEAQWNAITKYSIFASDIGAAVIHFAA